MKKLALVLGGGATKGYAHIGILKVLEENNIKPDLIVGTSMGAIVGGLYAYGKTCNQLVELSTNQTRKKLMDFNIFNPFFTSAVMSGKKLRKLLQSQIGDITHEQLQIPFTAVATNIDTGKLEILNTGSVLDNILASSAIPGVFPLVQKDGFNLCDGGLVNNVPDDVARRLGKNHIILSVDVIAEYAKQIEETKVPILGVTINAITLMQTQITKLKGSKSDLHIKICQPDVPQMAFDSQSAEKSIQNGIKAMNRNIAKLKKLLED